MVNLLMKSSMTTPRIKIKLVLLHFLHFIPSHQMYMYLATKCTCTYYYLGHVKNLGYMDIHIYFTTLPLECPLIDNMPR